MRQLCLLVAAGLAASTLSAAERERTGPDESAIRRAAALMPSPEGTLDRGLAVSSVEQPSCQVTMVSSTDAFDVATYFSWYSDKSQFQCMSAKPIEGHFRSANTGRIRRHFQRLAKNGFEAIAGVIYADPTGDGQQAHEMQWLRRAIRETKAFGLKFVPLYDFSIATYYSAKLCNVYAGPCPEGYEPVSEFNFDRYPILQTSVVDNLVMIADRFILPYADLERPARGRAKFLQRADGEFVRDEFGLLRPEIYIYIPRVWTDDSGFATIVRVLEEINQAYRDRGLGKPAYTLDVLVPDDPTFNPDLVAAFGDTAVRLTAFFAVSDEAKNLGELAEVQRVMYRQAMDELADHINLGELDPRLQIAAGTAVNFDKRAFAACNGGFGDLAWPATKPEDWLETLATMVEHTSQARCEAGSKPIPGEVPYQNHRYVYTEEGFESTWLCAAEGPAGSRYPNRYGCEPLLGFGELMRQLGER